MTFRFIIQLSSHETVEARREDIETEAILIQPSKVNSALFFILSGMADLKQITAMPPIGFEISIF